MCALVDSPLTPTPACHTPPRTHSAALRRGLCWMHRGGTWCHGLVCPRLPPCVIALIVPFPCFCRSAPSRLGHSTRPCQWPCMPTHTCAHPRPPTATHARLQLRMHAPATAMPTFHSRNKQHPSPISPSTRPSPISLVFLSPSDFHLSHAPTQAFAESFVASAHPAVRPFSTRSRRTLAPRPSPPPRAVHRLNGVLYCHSNG